MTQEEFTEYYQRLSEKAGEYVKGNSDMRWGQALMNAIGDTDRVIYRAITGTDSDPFYSDKRINKFINWLRDYFHVEMRAR